MTGEPYTITAILEGYLAATEAGRDFRIVHARGLVARVIQVAGPAHLTGTDAG